MRLTNTQVIETARRIVTGDLMVADLSNRSWQTSLALILTGLKDTDIRQGWIGLIVVPKGPHLSGFWLNGTAPGCTFEASLIHINDLPRLDVEIARMQAALYPETP
jgi:hypothetical protein